jgi:nicotinamidase-related amidase
MPVSTIDPKTALIVIDLQKGIVAYPTAHPIEQIVQHAAALATAFRRHNQPVVLVNVTGGAPGRTEQPRRVLNGADSSWAELVPELNQQSSDQTVTKQTWGAFTNTGLEAHLKSLGVTQVVLGGVATSIGVESTARQAYECGFNVVLAIDAMTDLNADAHTNSVTRIFPRLGETDATQNIADLLDRTHA